MRTIISILGLTTALMSCSEGITPATVLGPGPSDPAGPMGDPAGPTQDNLLGSTSAGTSTGAGGSFPGGNTTTGAGASTGTGIGMGAGGSSSMGPLPNLSCELSTTQAGSSGLNCIEFDSPTAAIAQAETTSCSSSMGTVGTGCSTTGLLGSCALPSTTAGLNEKEFFYSTGSLTAADAQTACTDANGTWTAG
jgi:hypothetical protein